MMSPALWVPVIQSETEMQTHTVQHFKDDKARMCLFSLKIKQLYHKKKKQEGGANVITAKVP